MASPQKQVAFHTRRYTSLSSDEIFSHPIFDLIHDKQPIVEQDQNETTESLHHQQDSDMYQVCILIFFVFKVAESTVFSLYPRSLQNGSKRQ